MATTQEFRTLLDRSHPSMMRLAHRLVGDDVEDVLQDAYVSAIRSLDQFEGKASMETWLYRIVYNKSIDHLRRIGRMPETEPVNEALMAEGLEPDSQASDRVDLAAALAVLPPAQRAAVLLVDADGFSYSDAGEILGLPTGTVASRVSRARTTLRRHLEVSTND